jgi:hypothetical protein
MARHLLTVEDVFTIKQRGLLIAGFAVDELMRFPNVGQAVVLHRPDGSKIRATFTGIHFHLPKDDQHKLIPDILVSGVTKEDVPCGTEVWTSD